MSGHGLPCSLNITSALTPKNSQPDTLAIEVRGLRKSYGAVEAVRGIDLQVSTGEGLCPFGAQWRGEDHNN